MSNCFGESVLGQLLRGRGSVSLGLEGESGKEGYLSSGTLYAYEYVKSKDASNSLLFT